MFTMQRNQQRACAKRGIWSNKQPRKYALSTFLNEDVFQVTNPTKHRMPGRTARMEVRPQVPRGRARELLFCHILLNSL